MASQAIELIKSRLNIADVVRRYVDLKPVSGRWMGVCPFHQETKPSMSVNEQEGFFYCFGCQAKGDVISFYQQINGLDFKDALKDLAQEAGVELDDMRPDPHADERRKKKKLLMDMHTWACEHFKTNLTLQAGKIAAEYLLQRGITPQIIRDFGVGYSLDEWHGLDHFLQSKGFTPDQGVESGLLSTNQKGSIYDRFRGRLIFPISNVTGQVIAFGGRILAEGEPKYLNSSDSPIYTKGEHLYGLHLARRSMNRTRRALLTEGYMDVLSLHQFGYPDSCGVLGTALTPDQVKRVGGFCSRVDLVFDGDKPGRKAAFRSAEMILLQGLKVGVVLMPDGEDVDSLLQTHGRDGFEACLTDAMDGLEFAAQTLRNEYSPKEIVDWAKRFLGKLADASLKAYYLPRLAQGLGLDEAQLRVGAEQAAERQQAQRDRQHNSQQQGGWQQGPSHNDGQQIGAQGNWHNGGPKQGWSNKRGQYAPRQKQQVYRPAPVGREDNKDKHFLRFPIQYPDYVPSLEEKGFMHVLTTPWAQSLWRKLVTLNGHDPMPHLEQQEQRLVAGFREEMTNMEPLDGDELAAEWNNICARIDKAKEKQALQQLREALTRAQAEGNEELVAQYLKALNDSLGRSDEQH